MKKRLLLIVIIPLFLFVTLIIGFNFFIYYKIPNKLDLNVHSKLKKNYKVKAGFIGVNLKGNSKKININKLGTYKSKFKYKYLFLNLSKAISVKVVDNEPPKYTSFDDKVEVYLNEEYDEKKYKCEYSDNYDSVNNIKISHKGEIDTSKVGDYYIVYTITDKSGNSTEKVRKVMVNKQSPLSLGVADFNLTDYFQDILLKETGDMGDEYMNNVYFAGDSVYWNFTKSNLYNSSRVWAKPCTDPANIYTQKVEVNNVQSQYTIPELINKNKPKYVVLNIGGCQSQYSTIEEFIEPYKAFLKDMQAKEKNTMIIVQTFSPVIEKTSTPYINNAGRNKFNYHIAQMCRELNVPLLDSSNILKDQNGSCKSNLCMDDGYHPNVTGMKMLIDYVRTHGYKE